jgi:hypothetical protein
VLTLAEAIKSDRLDEFIAQQEERKVIGPIDRAEFDGAVSRLIKAPPPRDQTSRSSSGGSSSGKRTRRDTDQDASN